MNTKAVDPFNFTPRKSVFKPSMSVYQPIPFEAYKPAKIFNKQLSANIKLKNKRCSNDFEKVLEVNCGMEADRVSTQESTPERQNDFNFADITMGDEPDKYMECVEAQPLSAMFDAIRTVTLNRTELITEKQNEFMSKLEEASVVSAKTVEVFEKKNKEVSKGKKRLFSTSQHVDLMNKETRAVKKDLMVLIARLENVEWSIDKMIEKKTNGGPGKGMDGLVLQFNQVASKENEVLYEL